MVDFEAGVGVRRVDGVFGGLYERREGGEEQGGDECYGRHEKRAKIEKRDAGLTMPAPCRSML
jgi:hypothetical protein